MKCTKVKNPCKICFQAVTKKNGLQCRGACRKWAHFKCLNYTPGKIQDIKAGIIKVTCPCPDCNTFEPKEVLADPPFTCTNTQCPANKLPVCESHECPNKENPIPIYPPPPMEYSPDSSQTCSLCPPPRRTPSPKRCPTCPLQQEPPKCPPPPPRGSPPPPKCPPPPPKCPPSPPKRPISPQTPLKSQSPPCPNPLHCPPSCKPVCPPTCPSYQNVKKGKKCCSPQQSQSCSNLSNDSNSSENQQSEQLRSISSESQIPNTKKCVDPKMLYSAIENLCNTVGQLSSQLKELMCKMQESR